jgi:hypothetical protein
MGDEIDAPLEIGLLKLGNKTVDVLLDAVNARLHAVAGIKTENDIDLTC